MGFEIGFDGQVVWDKYNPSGQVYVAEVTNWAGDITADVIDGTSMDNTNGWRRKKLGLRGGAGTIECNIDPDILPVLPVTDDTPVSLTLRTSATGGVNYEGDAVLSGVHPSAVVDGKCSLTIDFEFDGEVATALGT